MKRIFTSALLAAIVVAALPSVSQQADTASEDNIVLAQRFCPKGRC